MRINKYLSHHTNYSRREADVLIKDGRVKLENKVITDMSFDVHSGDKIFIDKKIVKPRTNYTVIVYNKKRGELTTTKDPMNRKTIFDTLPRKFAHFLPIGRLDFSSEGLLLLTDAPRIATALMTSTLPRTYNVKIDGFVREEMLTAMEEGITIEGNKGAFKDTKIRVMTLEPFLSYQVSKSTATYSRLKVSIGEGKNRELRRFFGNFDREVLDLKRVSYGEFSLNNLPSGKTRYLTNKEYDYLRTIVDKEKSSKKSKKSAPEPVYEEFTVMTPDKEGGDRLQ